MSAQSEMTSKSTAPADSCPTEIVGLILDNCYQDFPTLISSSLVCKAWVPATRRHLFSDVTVSVGRGIQRFGDLFHSPYATITPFVKSMAIIAAGVQRQTDTEEKLLLQLLSKLVVVPFHSFSLEFEKGEEPREVYLSKTARDFISSYRTVVDLTLDCDFGTLLDMIELFCSLPLLEVVNLSPQIHDASVCPQHRPPSTLRKVIIRRPLLEILDWIAIVTPDHSICDISLVYTPYEANVARISQFLKLQGNTLTQLALKSTDKVGTEDVHIDISSNDALRRLELHSLPTRHFEATIGSISNAPLLEEIRISFGQSPYGISTGFGKRVDEVLSEPHFQNLKSLTVERVASIRGFEDSLSRCRSRGILHWD